VVSHLFLHLVGTPWSSASASWRTGGQQTAGPGASQKRASPVYGAERRAVLAGIKLASAMSA